MKAKSTGDFAMVKKINTAIVLEAILAHAPLSRAQISERTGLNKATVSNLVQDLLDSHLVLEIGQGKSSGGRKPVMLIFNAAAGYAIGIDVGVNEIRGVLTGLDGEVATEAAAMKTPADKQSKQPKRHELTVKLASHDPDEAARQISACIDQLKQKMPASPYGLVGIGIGVPGIVDDQGMILFAPNLGWSGIELRQKLEQRHQVPVTIDNEANAGAQGEEKYGAGRGIANLVYVSVGIGIGTGIILNKELYKGAAGFSGELGHLSIERHGKPCRCGNIGCWELYASENALLEHARAAGYADVDLEQLLAAADAGDERVRAMFSSIGEALGIGIANIVNIFNPDAVIIGNRISGARHWIEAALQSAVERRALSYHRRQLKLQFAELEDQSAVRGAAYYAISRFFTHVKGSIGD
ncbi:ROK family protein [Paenibacillus sp. GCM10027626]|uniref:ROK family protein n=1 Tax=Paenibacillus sp. GCM10027626 TaxID=3273411 RepID=UPI003626E588